MRMPLKSMSDWPALQMNWCATGRAWEHPGGIQRQARLLLQAHRWTKLWVQKYHIRKKPAERRQVNGTSYQRLALPLRSWSNVMESWLFLHDRIVGDCENCSSHPMKDGHAAKPWSREFRKQVLPKFKRPGTMPERQKPLPCYRCTTGWLHYF